MSPQKSYTVHDLPHVAHDILVSAVLARKKNQAAVILLYGNLGAGKTTLTQSILKELGIRGRVVSPTFVIMKRYTISNKKHEQFVSVVHIDAYRIEDPSELIVLGWYDLLGEHDTLIIIEWPERIAPLLPKHTISVTLETISEHTRSIVVSNRQ